MTRAAAAADRGGPVHITPPRLGHAVLRRELTPMFGVLLLLTVMLAVAAAYEVRSGSGSATSPVFGRLLRRFDHTVLFMMAGILTLRTAVRTEEDHRAGWLSPAFTAGVSRWKYGAVLVLAELLAPAAIFGVAAVSFAISVRILDGTSELVNALPATLPAGVLVLGTYAVCAAVAGIALRHVPATVVVTALLVIGPLALRYRYFEAGIPLPLWLNGLSLLSPLVLAPADLVHALRAILYIGAGCALAGLVSHRFAGRQT